MIVIGRIFAWIVGGGNPNGLATSVMVFGQHINYFFALGTAGILDLMAIFIGYFGPFYFFPKALTSWGGSLMSQANKGIQQGVSPMKNIGNKEIGGLKERHQGRMGSRYDPDPNRQSRIKRGYLRLAAGNYIPTERGRRLTIAKGNQWKSDRNEEAAAFNKRQYEMGLTEGYTRTNPITGEREEMEPGLAAAKQGLVDMVGYDGNNANKKRAAQMAVEELLRTKSFWEIQNATISEGKYAGKRIHDTKIWQGKLQTNPDIWGVVSGVRPDAIPTVTGEEYAKGKDKLEQQIRKYAPEHPVEIEYEKNPDGSNKLDDRNMPIPELDATGNYKSRPISLDDYVRKRVADVQQRRSELGSDARLDDADRITKSLKDGYAEAAKTSGYAEGWWDEINNQAKLGNTAPREEMFKQFIQLASTGQGALGVLNHLSSGEIRTKVNMAFGGSSGQSGTAENDILGAMTIAARSDPQSARVILDELKNTGDAEVAIKAGQAATSGGAASGAAAPAASGTGSGSGGSGSPSGGGGPSAGGGTGTGGVGSGSSGPGTSGGGGGSGGSGNFGTWSGAPAPTSSVDYGEMANAVERGTRRANEGTMRIPHGFTPPAPPSTPAPGSTFDPQHPERPVTPPQGPPAPPQQPPDNS
jgi:hypothetical protein